MRKIDQFDTIRSRQITMEPHTSPNLTCGVTRALSPKSIIFTWPDDVTTKFSSFKSLCSIRVSQTLNKRCE